MTGSKRFSFPWKWHFDILAVAAVGDEMLWPTIETGNAFLTGWRSDEDTTVVTMDTLVWRASFSQDITSFPSSSELSECKGLVKLMAVLTGVDEEEEEEEEERWEEEDEEGATRSEEEEEEEVLGNSFSGLLQGSVHDACPVFTSALLHSRGSTLSPLFTGRWFGLGKALPSVWLSKHPSAPPSVPESSDREELDVSRDWVERDLKAWPLCSMQPLLQELAPCPPAPPTEEDVSKLRGPSCSGTFLISMLSFLSIRGMPGHSMTGERGEDGAWVWLWPNSGFVDVEENLLL